MPIKDCNCKNKRKVEPITMDTFFNEIIPLVQINGKDVYALCFNDKEVLKFNEFKNRKVKITVETID